MLYLVACELNKNIQETRRGQDMLVSPLQLKYKEKHVKERGSCCAVPDTPQILLAKTVSNLVSEVTPQRPDALLPFGADAQPDPLTSSLWVSAEQVQAPCEEALGPGLVHDTARDPGYHPRQGSDQARQWRKWPAPGRRTAARPLFLRIQQKITSCLFACTCFPLCHFPFTVSTCLGLLNSGLEDDSLCISFSIMATMADVGFATRHVA